MIDTSILLAVSSRLARVVDMSLFQVKQARVHSMTMKFMMSDCIKGLQKDFILSTSCNSTNMLTKLPGAFQLAKKKLQLYQQQEQSCTAALWRHTCIVGCRCHPNPPLIYPRLYTPWVGGKKNELWYPPSRTAQEKGDRDVVCTAYSAGAGSRKLWSSKHMGRHEC